MVIVSGLDLSLAATGAAHAYPGVSGDSRIGSGLIASPTIGVRRLRDIRTKVLAWVGAPDLIDLVVIEGPSYGSTGQYQHELAGLWWLVYEALDQLGMRQLVVSPKTLKVYATGSGNASKNAMLNSALQRLPWAGNDHNEADATWLAALGCDLLGEPIVTLPATHRRALAKLTLPRERTRP
jgi:crossover junction endodeoxyribonuclease RuvC